MPGRLHAPGDRCWSPIFDRRTRPRGRRTPTRPGTTASAGSSRSRSRWAARAWVRWMSTATRPERSRRESLRLALTFAEVATETILDAQAEPGSRDQVLHDAGDYRYRGVPGPGHGHGPARGHPRRGDGSDPCPRLRPQSAARATSPRTSSRVDSSSSRTHHDVTVPWCPAPCCEGCPRMTNVPAERLAEVLVEVADTLVDEFDLIEFLHMVTTRTSELVGAEAAGILLADHHGRLQLMAASDERTKLLELFQVQAEEGPCQDSFRSGKAVVRRRPRRGATAGRSSRPVPSRPASSSVHAFPLRLRTAGDRRAQPLQRHDRRAWPSRRAHRPGAGRHRDHRPAPGTRHPPGRAGHRTAAGRPQQPGRASSRPRVRSRRSTASARTRRSS